MGRADFYSDVELCFAADGGHLPLARAVACEVARLVSMDVGYVDDVRLVTNELLEALLPIARAEAMISCLFRLLESEIRLSLSVMSDLGRPPVLDPLRTQVMDRLVEQVSTIAVPASSGGYQIRADIVIAPGGRG